MFAFIRSILKEIIVALLAAFVSAGITSLYFHFKNPKIESVFTQIIPAPPDWGKPIEGSRGTIMFFDGYRGYFSGKIDLIGAKPNHTYLFTINGIPGQQGNDLLSQSIGGEKYKDIIPLVTDSLGRVCGIPFKSPLEKGKYFVKLFIKEDDNAGKIILYNNFVEFKVN